MTYSQDGESFEHNWAIVVHTYPAGIGLMFAVSSRTLTERALKTISRPAFAIPLRTYDAEHTPGVAANRGTLPPVAIAG